MPHLSLEALKKLTRILAALTGAAGLGLGIWALLSARFTAGGCLLCLLACGVLLAPNLALQDWR